MDFGAGHGRLIYLIIQHILKQKQIFFPDDDFPFLFVLTDCSQAIIDWWKQSEYLNPLIEKGYLDICNYDVESTYDVRVSFSLLFSSIFNTHAVHSHLKAFLIPHSSS